MVDAFAYRLPGVGGEVRFQLAEANAKLLHETDQPNDTLGQAQPIAQPAEIAGRFLTSRDVDWYRFTARGGKSLWIEAIGERAGGLIDLDIGIHDASGKLLETIADTKQPKEIPAALPLDTVDPSGAWKPPADGDYFLAIRDLYDSVIAGPDRTYRLSIGPRLEAARVVAIVDNLALKPGGSASLELIAIRRNGQQAPIRIEAHDLPPGLAANEITIAAGKSTGTLKLTCDKSAADWTGALHLVAESEIVKQTTTLPVRSVILVQDSKPPRVRLTQGIPAAILAASKK
jgi:hypothetical protein